MNRLEAVRGELKMKSRSGDRISRSPGIVGILGGCIREVKRVSMGNRIVKTRLGILGDLLSWMFTVEPDPFERFVVVIVILSLGVIIYFPSEYLLISTLPHG
jgi:hypothetical protein